MASNTEYLHLVRPDFGDYYNIGQFNQNFNKIDELMMTHVATWYPNDGTKNVDELKESFVMIDTSSEVNPELYNIFDGESAWVWTNHASDLFTDYKVQFAMRDVNGDKIAFRTRGPNGWFPWKVVETTANHTYSTEDLTAGESELETGKLYFVYE